VKPVLLLLATVGISSAQAGVPEVRIAGPAATNDAALSDSIDLVSAARRGC